MGKIVVTGKAIEYVEMDLMKKRITINSRENSPKRAIAVLRENTEQLLTELKVLLGDLRAVRLHEEEIDFQDFSDDEAGECRRSFLIAVPLNLELCDRIVQLLATSDYYPEYMVGYYHSNPQEIEERLLEKAVLDSKQKAEKIAQYSNQTLKGIREVKSNSWHSSAPLEKIDWMECEQERLASPNVSFSELSQPEERLSKEVEIVWNCG
ncbi:TPA: SIMPL domain-containing protein [Streptococcus suis]|nr:SIMPL domain-containing protein [Streptococcus suis]